MKLKKMLFLSLSMAIVFFSSCKTEEPVTGIILDEATMSVEVGATSTLTATLLPKGATGTVVWSTSDATIATVDAGVVTGVKIGTANIVATVGSFTATCVVSVTESTDRSASLAGSEYYPFILDGVTAAALGSKIKADFRPDEANKFLYIWDNTYTAGTPTGPNFYGQVESWASFIVAAPAGWSGAGFNILTAGNETALASLKKITDNPDDYFLHIGIKSKDNTTHAILLDGQTTVKFAIGPTGFVDGDKTYPALADFTRDGEWHEIEIPIKTLTNMGLTYSNIMTNPNILAILSGSVAGKTLDLDAVFIYKK